MARSRILNPGLFRHVVLQRAEVETGLPLRLAFAGLWCVADREGRFAWEPEVLKLDILPFDAVDFGAILTTLDRLGLIQGYPKANPRHAFLPNFLRYQRPHQREAPSRYPAPPSEEGSPRADLRQTQGTPKDTPRSTVSVSVSDTNSVSVAVTGGLTDGLGKPPSAPLQTESVADKRARMLRDLRPGTAA